MPAQTSSLKDKLPNQALTGPELREIAIKEFTAMLDRDYAFGGSVAYRRVAISMQATFHLGHPHQPLELKSRVAKIGEVVEGEAPLNPVPAESSVVGIKREVKLENPNIDRIAHDMPITVQRSTPPDVVVPDSLLPGEPPAHILNQPGVETLEFRYDKTQFPAAPEPVDTDNSQEMAARLGVPQFTGKSTE